ncbi:MAG: tetratricopeptide repeat protein [Bacteroidota bacterium]|nr:tetratricopeptide repeat protein [Bacteroidota bacterium]
MKKTTVFITALVFSIFFGFSQQPVDSLYSKLSKCTSDSCKARLNNLLINELFYIDVDKADALAEKLNKNVKESDDLNYSEAQLNYGSMFLRKEKFNKAFEIFNKLQANSLSRNDKLGVAKAKYGLMRYYIEKNELTTAIEIGFEALREFEKLQDYYYTAATYGKIGAINYKLKNSEKAADYFKKSLEVSIKHGSKNNIAYAYNNLGNIYSSSTKMYDIALEYYRRALNIRKELNHVREIAPILSNMGIIYSDKKEYNKAEQYYKESLELNLKYGKKRSICICYTNIGNVYFEQNDSKKADFYYREALKYLDDDFQIKELLYYNLGEVNLKLGNLEDALKYNDTCMTIKDSLYSREAIKSLNEMQVKYETEKTQLELEKKDLESKNKQVMIYAALGGCILLLGLAFFIFRGLRQKQKDNTALEQMNSIIIEKSKIVEEQHKDITDSIKYAERIQTAILPPDKLWKEILPQSFVYYRPKDILSGDFYWIEETATHLYIAAADCTGHGVPGALVSIVNYNLLNKAVLEKGLTDPAQILDQVNEWLTQALHQSYNEASVRDGMDVSLCAIHKKTKVMQFAGAFNSGYMVKEGLIIEMPADKKPVGAFIEDNITSFTSKEYQLNGNETIYLFSDGYADQFGGPKGKKFKYKNLQKLILESQPLEFEAQKEKAKQTFLDWKGGYEQTDDVLLIGFKFA